MPESTDAASAFIRPRPAPAPASRPLRPSMPPAEATPFSPRLEPAAQQDARPTAPASVGPTPAAPAAPVEPGPAVAPATERAVARHAEAQPAETTHAAPAFEAPRIPDSVRPRDAWSISRESVHPLRRPSPLPGQASPPQPVALEHRLNQNGGALDDEGDRGATGPQLRRFIKSRAYVPMHELRRRFAINGHDDDVTAVDLEKRRVFVGLPDREGRLLGELLRGGDIGYELSMDPITPIVVGVYPMRPITRP